MRMFSSSIDTQFSILITSQWAVLRKHTLNSTFNYALRVLARQQETWGIGFNAAYKAGMAVILLVFHLAAGELYLFSIDNNNVVASINMRGENGFVLAAQQHG